MLRHDMIGESFVRYRFSVWPNGRAPEQWASRGWMSAKAMGIFMVRMTPEQWVLQESKVRQERRSNGESKRFYKKPSKSPLEQAREAYSFMTAIRFSLEIFSSPLQEAPDESCWPCTLR